MNVLLIGSGGREHALFWKLSQSSHLTSLRVYPGNGGFPRESLVNITDGEGKPASVTDIASIRRHVEEAGYDLVVVGPEQPLVEGITDALEGVAPVFGPSGAAARLEGSKEFAKEFMRRNSIPTARAETFTQLEPALQYLEECSLPVVIKADGLAAGKGVTVAHSREEAERAVKEALEEGRFGSSGHKILIEEFLRGQEASVFALCDGERAIPFVAARDYKRAYDDDQGPNTGGMGAFAPVPLVTPAIMERVRKEVLDPVMEGMRKEGTPYRGLLYAGLMIDGDEVNVVEFNCRFGDPETQPLMRLLDEDLLELFSLAASGSLENRPLRFRPGSAMIVVLAAEGYPGSYAKGVELGNLDSQDEEVILFHAGTMRQEERILSNGGRILGVTSYGSRLEEARERAYRQMERIRSDRTFYRKDIGESRHP